MIISTPKEFSEDNDEFLDWESRAENVPMWKHMIAGN